MSSTLEERGSLYLELDVADEPRARLAEPPARDVSSGR